MHFRVRIFYSPVWPKVDKYLLRGLNTLQSQEGGYLRGEGSVVSHEEGNEWDMAVADIRDFTKRRPGITQAVGDNYNLCCSNRSQIFED